MDLGGCSNMAEVFITTDDLEGLFSEEDAWMCHSTNLHNPAPHYHPEHLASVDVEAPTGSHEHDNPLFAFLGADDDDEVRATVPTRPDPNPSCASTELRAPQRWPHLSHCF